MRALGCLYRTNHPFWLFAALEQLLAAPLRLLEGEGIAALRAAISFFQVDLGNPWDVKSPEESRWALAEVLEPERELCYQNSLYW